MAIDKAKKAGASYAEYRQVQIQSEYLSYADGHPDEVTNGLDEGFGIRVIAKGSWGFCGSAEINEDEIGRAANKAVDIAKASALLQAKPVVLAPVKPSFGQYVSFIEKSPFEISLKEKLDFLAHLDELMSRNTGISSRFGFLEFRRVIENYFNSDGSAIYQMLYQSGVGVSATAARSHRDRATRSYPANEGAYENRGYELLQQVDFDNNIPTICEQAVALLDADPCPQKVCDVVLDGSHLSLVIHESIGHPLELDRVLGSERNFSGTSFATPDKLGKLQYASPIVNVVSDPTARYGLGSFGYDDEGVKAQPAYLIKDGILVNYLSSRETAAMIGTESTGAMRADGWGNIPLVRMTNTNLLPGKDTFEDLVAGIDDGLYLVNSSSWSIDDNRENFQFGCEIGWEIKGGKLGKMIKNPTYSSNTIAFWNSCDGIGNEPLWRLWGTPNCGKGQPGQNGRVGQGAAPARFRNVRIGV